MKEMKVITFLNNKGGVGKSASISAVAHILASVYGKKVLMVDLIHRQTTVSCLAMM